MGMDPQQELREIVGQVRAHLERQQELGLDRTALRWPQPAAPAPAARPTLEQVRTALGECTRCKLHTTRTQIVFGVGNPKARLVFVGEAPGADEDAQGEPFVGRAGQLLTKIIEAMGLRREDVYICNIIKCRPPNNRTPESDEIVACQPFLLEQLRAIEPQFICALGGPAAQTLLQTKEPISRLRGRFHDYHGIPLLPTFHPAFLLRNPSEKKTVWEDMKLLLRHLQA
jgi:DNA polymerase